MSESSHEKKPTLNADMFEHVSAFGNARSEDFLTGTNVAMHQFLQQDNLSPMWKIAANIELSKPNTGIRTLKIFEAAQQYLIAAEHALEEARKLYIHDHEDKKELDRFEERLERLAKGLVWPAERVGGTTQVGAGCPENESTKSDHGSNQIRGELQRAQAMRRWPYESFDTYLARLDRFMEDLITDSEVPPEYKFKAHLIRSLIEPISEDPKPYMSNVKRHFDEASKMLEVVKVTYAHEPKVVQHIMDLHVSMQNAERHYHRRLQTNSGDVKRSNEVDVNDDVDEYDDKDEYYDPDKHHAVNVYEQQQALTTRKVKHITESVWDSR